jgi:hypothetical protein
MEWIQGTPNKFQWRDFVNTVVIVDVGNFQGCNTFTLKEITVSEYAVMMVQYFSIVLKGWFHKQREFISLL